MKASNIAVLAGLGLFAWWAYKKYSTVVNLQFVPRGLNFEGTAFGVVLGVQNTSNDSLVYNSFAGTLYVNGTNVANVADFTPREIVANAETDLPFTVTPSITGVISDVIDTINSGGGITSATIQGVANIGGNQYQVNVKLM